MKSELDKFYTNPKVAENCVNVLKKYVSKTDVLIEPSAGNGSFSSLLNCTAYDIAPERNDIIQKNWFDVELPNECVVFGNPPFGNRNDLTKKFITHSLQNAKIIAFVLPKVFQKKTMQSVFPDNWSLVENIPLPKNSFLLENKPYHVPAVFQIWIKDHPINNRESIKFTQKTDDFEFSKNGEWFIFGAAPHKIIPSKEKLLNNRGYTFYSNEEIVERLRKIDWKKHALSSVSGGVAWFSKQQIITVYNEVYYDKQQ